METILPKIIVDTYFFEHETEFHIYALFLSPSRAKGVMFLNSFMMKQINRVK